MLHQVRRHLLDHLPAGTEPAAVLDRVVTIDASRGAVDGSCFIALDADGEPLLVAKSAQTPGGQAIIRTEFETLTQLEAGGMNAAREEVPHPIGLWEEEGVLVTLQSALRGRLLKNEPGSEFFGGPRLETTLTGVLEWYARFVRCAPGERVTIDEAVYEREVAGPTTRFLARYRTSAEVRALLEGRLLDERPLFGRTLPLIARHADFCTANMMLQPDGLAVFDWEFDLTPRLPMFDPFFFVSSTRWPHRGLRGESSHFDSFLAVFWGDNAFAQAARGFLRSVAALQQIPVDALPELFLVALVHVANMKYEGLVEATGITVDEDDAATRDPAPEEDDDDARRRRWAVLPRSNKDVPFACLRDGRMENLAEVARRGLPDFGTDGATC